MISSSPGGYSLTAISVEPTRSTPASTTSAPARCADIPEGERDVEPRTVGREPIGQGEQVSGPGRRGGLHGGGYRSRRQWQGARGRTRRRVVAYVMCTRVKLSLVRPVTRTRLRVARPTAME